MNKKGFVWFVWLAIILVGILISYFILKAIFQLVVDVTIWALTLGIIIFGAYALYKLFKWIFPSKKRK